MVIDSSNPVIQATLITSGVTILGVLINVLSTYWSKQIELSRSHRDRVFSRREQSVDELVTQLDMYILRLSDEAEQVFKVGRSIYHLVEIEIMRRTSKYGEGLKASRPEEEFGFRMDDLRNQKETYEWPVSQEKWFALTAVRLTYWLENSESIEHRLEKLEHEFSFAYFLLRDTEAAFPDHFQNFPRRYDELTEDHLAIAKDFHFTDFDSVEVVKDTIRSASQLQRELIELVWRGRPKMGRVMLRGNKKDRLPGP